MAQKRGSSKLENHAELIKKQNIFYSRKQKLRPNEKYVLSAFYFFIFSPWLKKILKKWSQMPQNGPKTWEFQLLNNIWPKYLPSKSPTKTSEQVVALFIILPPQHSYPIP